MADQLLIVSRMILKISAPTRRAKQAHVLVMVLVVVTICAAALRAWLDDRRELPDAPLVAMIPMSVRTAEQRGTFGNRVSTMAVAIPTDVADPLARLEAAHEALRSAKEHHRAAQCEEDADLVGALHARHVDVARVVREVRNRVHEPDDCGDARE